MPRWAGEQRYPRETLRWLHWRLGLSQPAFALALGANARTVRGWENGQTRGSRPYQRHDAPLLVPYLNTDAGQAWLRTLGEERGADG